VTRIRVADFVASWLRAELGADKIFLVTGAGSMHLTDGIAKRSDILPVCLHHEQSVSMAVEAYSRASGKVGVACVSTGPAATNALTGLAGAWQDSVACLFISGQVKRSESSRNSGVPGLRQFGVQELDIIPIVESVTKYANQIVDPAFILFELEKAKHLATTGRPGPVWLELPLDVQSAYVEVSELAHFVPDQASNEVGKNTGEIEEMLGALASSSRPVILVGQGVRLAGCSESLARFVRQHRIPVVSSYLGTDSYLPHDSLYIGKIGVKGERAANIATQKADFLLVLGCSLHVSTIGYNYENFAPHAEKWVVDIDRTSHAKRTVTNLSIIESSLEEFFDSEGMRSEGKAFSVPGWHQWASVAAQLARSFPTALAKYESEIEGLNIYTVVERVSRALREGDVVVSDAGSAFYAVSQGIRLGEAQRYIPSGAMATMGYSLPAAIGVAFSKNCLRVVAFTGDGSLHQNIQELGQMAFLKLPIVLIVLNNDGYLSIRASQMNYFDNRFIGTDDKSGLGLPDISAIARAYEIPVVEVETVAQLEDFLTSTISMNGPVLVNVKTPRDQAIVPTVSSKIDDQGVMSSRNLEDMTPLLDEDVLEEVMSDDWGFL